MKKITPYFSHDSNARNDEKMLALRMRLGVEGYGIYFMILERLRDEADYISIKDYNVLAFDFRVSSDKVKSVVEDYKLFEFSEDGKKFYSLSFNQRMIPLENTRAQRSNAGKESAKKRAELRENLTVVDNTINDRIAKNQQSKVKESKEEEIKLKKRIKKPEPVSPLPDQVEKIDFNKLVETFHQLCPGLPKVREITEERKKAVRARVKQFGKAKIKEVLEKVGASKFLNGDNDRNFTVSFDWIFSPKNFVKILEGNYDNKENQKSKNKSNYPAPKKEDPFENLIPVDYSIYNKINELANSKRVVNKN